MGMDSPYGCKCATTDHELCELGLLLVFEQQNMSQLSTSLFVPCCLTNERTHVFTVSERMCREVFCLLPVVFSELTLKESFLFIFNSYIENVIK